MHVRKSAIFVGVYEPVKKKLFEIFPNKYNVADLRGVEDQPCVCEGCGV